MEGSGKSAGQLNFRIPKKKGIAQSEDVHNQSPLSRLPDSHQWDYPLKEWKLETRNNSYHTKWKRKRHFEKYHINDEGAAFGYRRYQRKPDEHLVKPSKGTESSNSVPNLRRCDVVLEDCTIKNKERDHQEKGRNDSKNASPGLRGTCFQNNECRKRRCDRFSSQLNVHSRKKSLPTSTQSTESPGCRRSSENHQDHEHIPQQENILQPLELEWQETFTTANQGTTISCPGESCSNTSSERKQHSVISKDVQISPPVTSPKKQEVNTTLPLKEPRNIPEQTEQTAASAEPIVLSSDEEERNDEANDKKSCIQTREGHRPENKETKQEYVQPLSEELSKDLIESKTEQVSTESLILKDTEDCRTSEQMDLVLDVKFSILFIGNYKGTATGCTRFTTSYIKIPVEVALNKKMDLLVDTRHLIKLGLWSDNNDSSTLMSNDTIFLWLSSNYVKQIENQVGTSLLNKQAKGSEFLFLKLPQALTEGEQAMLTKIILEVSKKNSTPDLADFLPWKQAIILLQDISAEENSFFDYCYASFQQQKESSSVLVSPQDSKLSLTKPIYSLLLKQSGGLYSSLISSAKEDEWKEFQETRSVQYLIVYPPSPAKGGLGVTREDLECLEYGEFLNDVIIDFYLKYLLLEKAPRKLADKSHIFSSFFYKCLTRTEQNSEENPNLSLAQRRHKRVKRWTRHINILNKDYIFVPVNEESHWYLAVICFPWLEDIVYEDCLGQCSLQSPIHPFPVQPVNKSETIRTETALVFNDNRNDKEINIHSNLQPNDNIQHDRLSPALDSKSFESPSSSSEIKKLCKRPCILILDSLKASSIQNTVQVLREYLELEWEAKRKMSREFSKSTMVDYCPRVPKQDNNSDCGIYLLQYVETFFQSPIVNFELPLRLERWFPRQLVRNKREEIRDLILQLHLQQQNGSKS